MQPTPDASRLSTENGCAPADRTAGTWDFFDKIFCISVVERSDRREMAKSQFAGVGLLDRVEFVIVVRHPENPEQGIFESHLLCLEKGLDAGARHILIFEDDVFFSKFDAQTLDAACLQLARTAWNAFALGCITSGSSKTPCRSLVSIRYRCLTHAYALSSDFAARIVREKWQGEPYDMLLRKQCAKWSGYFALYPMCAFQGLSGTDNQTVRIDKLRRLFGGLPFIQRMNEFYQNHKVQVWAAHLLVPLVLIVLAWTLW